ncbi:(S)-ureidoglycine aminohydrolase [Luteolibacter marinus]|uniref:(S)-ureidoglycine aminohydrolase n=1 Tax=Luteolibacter marinus TaxID=2776705 RepID=UPI0018678AF4|nr:(S)-ureidoglycine aminohydrolase [Luteolibacter marinus]
MSELFGLTRTRVAMRHALIALDGHVPSAFPGWDGADAYVLLSPAIGAEISQLLVCYQTGGGTAWFPAGEYEHVIYIEKGDCRVVWDDGDVTLGAGGFVFVPSENVLALHGSENTRLTIFRKIYEPVDNLEAPPAVHGHAADIPGEPFLGNDKARLQTLLPVDSRYDLAVNIFTYQPGATLPFVETHIMEHGLLMLSGQGVYRLEESYYPVKAGDAIWMAPYCPQWFVAMGDEPASYLYYKDVHRLP